MMPKFYCDGCNDPISGKPDQVVDVFDETEVYCRQCSENTEEVANRD